MEKTTISEQLAKEFSEYQKDAYKIFLENQLEKNKLVILEAQKEADAIIAEATEKIETIKDILVKEGFVFEQETVEQAEEQSTGSEETSTEVTEEESYDTNHQEEGREEVLEETTEE